MFKFEVGVYYILTWIISVEVVDEFDIEQVIFVAVDDVHVNVLLGFREYDLSVNLNTTTSPSFKLL